MKKIKTTLIALGVALGMLVGGAAAANAYSTYKNAVYVGNYTYEIWVTVDYDWWEETFQWKHDYRYFSHYIYCPPGRICAY